MAAYKPDSRGRCPHCLTAVRFESGWLHKTGYLFGDDKGVGEEGEGLASSERERSHASENVLRFIVACCPECEKVVLTVGAGRWVEKSREFVAEEEFVAWPRSARPPVPDGVPSHIAADYKEAALVLNHSPKASAALSRRCLQAILREIGNANQSSLSKQIDAVMPNVPSYIAESIDAIRNIGNFAAHPIKDQSSGQIVDVEPGEAEWNLDVLDMLFGIRAKVTRARSCGKMGRQQQSKRRLAVHAQNSQAVGSAGAVHLQSRV